MEAFLLKLSIMVVPGLLAITCHEVSHGYVANRCGDDTARMMGRLTLNPLKHLDLIGSLMIFIVHFGWAKPVPVNFNNLRHPRRDMILVAIAGPITNFTLATLSAGALRLIPLLKGVPPFLLQPVILMLCFSIYINIILGVFNLVPLPPLDGGRIAVGLLPYRQAVAFSRIEPFGFMILIIIMFATPLFDYLLEPALTIGIRILAGPLSGEVFQAVAYIGSLPNFFQALRM